MMITYDYIKDKLYNFLESNENIEYIEQLSANELGYPLLLKFKCNKEFYCFTFTISVSKNYLPLIINNIEKLEKVNKLINDYTLIQTLSKNTNIEISRRNRLIPINRGRINTNLIEDLDLVILY